MTAFLIINLVFFVVNIYWNNRLFEKKNELEEKERQMNKKDVENISSDVLDMLFNSEGNEHLKDIIERVMKKFPNLTKTEILFKPVNELLKMLGEEEKK
jgi:GTP cyclohydrolase I